MAQDGEHRVVAQNRKARYEYDILDRFETGLVLLGPEVKSLREGRANLTDAYALVHGGEVFLHNAHISPYTQASRENSDPRRTRKLLLHRAEISRLQGRVAEKGLLLVALSLYFKDGRAKLELGLARKRRRYDKREAIRKRTEDRELRRELRGRRR